MASFSLSRKQKAVACAVGIVPLTISGIGLLRCGCTLAAFTIEIVVGLLYFIWVLLWTVKLQTRNMMEAAPESRLHYGIGPDENPRLVMTFFDFEGLRSYPAAEGQ